MSTLYYKDNNAWKQLNLLTNLSGSDLQNLRKEMGLGDTLGVLPIENGGTAYDHIPDDEQVKLYLQQSPSSLNGDEPVFMRNLLAALNIVNGVYYPIGALLAYAKSTASGNAYDSLSLNLTRSLKPAMTVQGDYSGISTSGSKVILTKPGIYNVSLHCKCTYTTSGSMRDGRLTKNGFSGTISFSNLFEMDGITEKSNESIAINGTEIGSSVGINPGNVDGTKNFHVIKTGGSNSEIDFGSFVFSVHRYQSSSGSGTLKCNASISIEASVVYDNGYSL